MLKALCFTILLILSSWPATLVAQERYLSAIMALA